MLSPFAPRANSPNSARTSASSSPAQIQSTQRLSATQENMFTVISSAIAQPIAQIAMALTHLFVHPSPGFLCLFSDRLIKLRCCTDYHSYLSEPRPFDQCDWSIDDWCKSVTPNVVPPLPPTQPVYSSPFMIPCMWGECKASFASLGELVGHVNLEHLRQPTFLNNTPEADPLPCLWQNCDLSWSPECIASSSTASEFDSLRAALETHLLQDHLGLKDHPLGRQQAIASQAAPSPTEISPTISSASHFCASSTHICRWQSCGMSFESCDALTAHITTTHVGSGKTQYECFWEGCQRHGEHGFSSKQKICRHVQVSPSFPPKKLFLMLVPSFSRTPGIDPSSVKFVNKTSRKPRPSNSTCGGTHRRVSYNCTVYLIAPLTRRRTLCM